MAPVLSSLKPALVFSIGLLAFARGTCANEEVCAANGTCTNILEHTSTNTGAPTPLPTSLEALNQLCEYPQLKVCRPDRSTGTIKDAIRVFYDKWDTSDPRREFIEMVYMIKPPTTEDASYDEYNFKVASYLEPIYLAHKELFDKEEAEEELNPEPEPEPFDLESDYPGKDIIEKDQITTMDICCPNAEWACKHHEFDGTAYCYNSNLTSMLVTEDWKETSKAGWMNLKDFTYTRRDGAVFSFMPAKFEQSTDAAKPSTTQAVTTSPGKINQTTIKTSQVGSMTTGSATATYSQKNFTTAGATESGSAASQFTLGLGSLSALVIAGQGILVGLGALMIL